MVLHGEISLKELEMKMCEAWDANWPWKVRQLVDIPFINLKEGNDRERVTVKIIAWEGDNSDIGQLAECWVHIRGIPPRWYPGR
jgi:hypothetical protein